MTLHDLDRGQLDQWGQAWTPDVILKRRLRHHRHFLLEKDPHDSKNTSSVRSWSAWRSGADTG